MKALVVGYGSIGKRHIQNLIKFKNIEILVVTNRPFDKFLKKHNCKIFKNIQDSLFEKPTFAIISNVSSLHTSTARLLAKHNVHLFIEKPLSDSLRGVDTLLSETKKHHLITQIGCHLRFHPCMQKIKKIINAKKLGKIISIQIENGSYLPNWHPSEDYAKSYAAQKKLGGGVILTCIHEIDYLYWIFGDVKEIFSFSGKFSNLKIDSEDLSTILMKMKKDSIVEMHLDYFRQPSVRKGKAIGTLGTLTWDLNKNNVRFYNIKAKKWTDLVKLKKYDYNQMYYDELKHFMNCIINKKQTINSVNTGIKTLKIALAVKRSYKQNKVIKL